MTRTKLRYVTITKSTFLPPLPSQNIEMKTILLTETMLMSPLQNPHKTQAWVREEVRLGLVLFHVMYPRTPRLAATHLLDTIVKFSFSLAHLENKVYLSV